MANKTKTIPIRAAHSEVMKWKDAAALDGRSLSSWIRRQCDLAAVTEDELDLLKAATAVKTQRRRGAADATS